AARQASHSLAGDDRAGPRRLPQARRSDSSRLEGSRALLRGGGAGFAAHRGGPRAPPARGQALRRGARAAGARPRRERTRRRGRARHRRRAAETPRGQSSARAGRGAVLLRGPVRGGGGGSAPGERAHREAGLAQGQSPALPGAEGRDGGLTYGQGTPVRSTPLLWNPRVPSSPSRFSAVTRYANTLPTPGMAASEACAVPTLPCWQAAFR